MLAMLDRATEDTLYARFRDFFLTAEEGRRWNLWQDVPWEAVNPAVSADLIEAALAAYGAEAFLPDQCGKTLHMLRSSRGRAWFVTRWSYEEGKHLIALGEWLVRSGQRTDEQVKEYADALLGETEWQPAIPEPVPLMVETLLREYDEAERYHELRAHAEREKDGALVTICGQLLSDEGNHAAFFRDALLIIAERSPALVADGARRILDLPFAERHADRLRVELKL